MFGSIYGPGVLNDTIVPGYGITEFPLNFPAWNALNNKAITAFGGANQYVTRPQGHPAWMYQLAQNNTDPNHISQWNPMLIGTGINLNTDTTNPFLTQQGQMAAYNWGQNYRIQQEIQSAIQGIAGALNSMENGLSNALKSDKLTNAQKAELKGLLEEVKALKEKIAKQLKDKNPEMEEVTAMQKEVQDLQKKVSDAASKINGEVGDSGDSKSSEGAKGSEGGSGDSSDADNAELLKDSKYKDIDAETGRPTSLGDVPSKSECRQFCATIFDAIDGCGTKNEVIEETIPGLTAANIVEVIALWEKSYGSGEQGLIRRLLDDLGHFEKKKFVPMLLDALQTRAEALGIGDEIDSYVANVTKELGDCNISDGICSKNLMAIYDKIVEKEKSNKDGAATVIKDKKADNKKKTDGRKQEVINEKKNEIANKLKEALKLKEVPQLSSALKIETDDDGEFTGYSIELNTQNGKVKVTGQTYQELALAIEKNNLKVEDVLIRKTQA